MPALAHTLAPSWRRTAEELVKAASAHQLASNLAAKELQDAAGKFEQLAAQMEASTAENGAFSGFGSLGGGWSRGSGSKFGPLYLLSCKKKK